MEENRFYQKVMDHAQCGRGRRLHNCLNKKENNLSADELDRVIQTYCDAGLSIELNQLKKRRGILSDSQYNRLKENVIRYASAETFLEFMSSLKDLVTCGIKMNPLKND